MKTKEQSMRERFVYRPVVHFSLPHRRLSHTIHEGTMDWDALGSLYPSVEIPYEIVEHIYSLGWKDAKAAMVEAIGDE